MLSFKEPWGAMLIVAMGRLRARTLNWQISEKIFKNIGNLRRDIKSKAKATEGNGPS